MIYDGDHLSHHGIKGMKWGIRRTPEQLGRKSKVLAKNKANFVSELKARKEAKKPTEEERRQVALTTHSAKKLAKNMDTLSDKELQQRYNRLNLEQNVRNLSRQQTNTGARIVKDSGKELAKDMVKSYAKKGLTYAVGAGVLYGMSKAGAGKGVTKFAEAVFK